MRNLAIEGSYLTEPIPKSVKVSKKLRKSDSGVRGAARVEAIGTLYANLIQEGIARNPSLKDELYANTMLGVSLLETDSLYELCFPRGLPPVSPEYIWGGGDGWSNPFSIEVFCTLLFNGLDEMDSFQLTTATVPPAQASVAKPPSQAPASI
ncbi:hypothetical protein ACA910_009031 [Epithemia clementina (nom. ined.)]